MSANFKRRWDIYVNGVDGAKQLIFNSLFAWRILMPVCGVLGEAIVELIRAACVVALIIILPFLFWLAPIAAIFSAHRICSDDEVRARMRANIHQNGRPEK